MRLTKAQRVELKQKYGGHCSYCGVELNTRWQADHLEPVERNFEYYRCKQTNTTKARTTDMRKPENDTIENMMPSCVKCNNDKSSESLENWRKIIVSRIHTLNTDPKYASYQKAKRYGLVVETNIEVVFWFEKHKEVAV
jgi:5-methylcytosine-specific restriction endonuclease McrA